MAPASMATTRGIPHMATRRFAGCLGGTTAGPGTGRGGIPCGSPPVPGAGALLEKDCIFSFQPSGPRYNRGVASTVKTMDACQRLSPGGQKFIFFGQLAPILGRSGPSTVEKRYTAWRGRGDWQCPAGRESWSRPRMCASGSESLRPSRSFFGSCWNSRRSQPIRSWGCIADCCGGVNPSRLSAKEDVLARNQVGFSADSTARQTSMLVQHLFRHGPMPHDFVIL